ncbi:Anaerobic dimethyl sulfoxide reductase chain C [Lysobacter dokdonensis DS-58]|uniref:Anaerobic dimethyl sulfoxide reductase chain C n=1 Tax=Lysobacter dokdonensis DS-58 TaxID=1300345 RepID=A0A0A2WIC5_9GAMM|nr:DmsC/YnfH family molybdoenzyme membrane anchor subunit [Lysobacter dokdonensis]KGQ18005.1 Anaerobic dimethyl sulfoxide reductase chain C [Lysobacter dokdonensis DS-58]
MHPALSVIFFTTLSGAGYGLLFWTAYAVLCGQGQPRALLIAIAVSVVLSTIGLLSSLWHLGKPARAWRAFSQWRTSWLSREGVASLATFVAAVALAATLLPDLMDGDARGTMPSFDWTGRGIAVLAMAMAMATVFCTAMIYASLKPIPAWRHRLVPTVYVLFALFTGGLLDMVIRGPDSSALLLILLAAALWIMKVRYWRAIGAALPATRGDAIGLPGRTATVFERPHTEANYLTREMGFVVARKHAKWLRVASVALFAVIPIVLLAPVIVPHLHSMPLLVVAALSALAGAFVERWLFFAEAKHMVTLYY